MAWDRGKEPDLTAYEILRTDDGEAEPSMVDVDDACGDGGCTATVTVPEKDAGTRVGFAVRARRLKAPDSQDTIASPDSETVAVDIPGQDHDPSPTPTDDESSGTDPSDQPGTPPGRGGGDPPPAAGSPGSGSGPLPGMPAPEPLPRPGGSAGVNLPGLFPTARDAGPQPSARSPIVAPSGSTAKPSKHPQASAPESALDSRSWLRALVFGLALVVLLVHLGIHRYRMRPAPAGGATAKHRYAGPRKVWIGLKRLLPRNRAKKAGRDSTEP